MRRSPAASVIRVPRGAPTLGARKIQLETQGRASAGKHVLVVDMYAAFSANTNFDADYLSDFLHPTAAGYDVMAETWYRALAPFLR